MKIAVVGSREFKDLDFARKIIIRELIFAKPIDDIEGTGDYPILVSGGARGIDKLGEEVAKRQRVEPKIFKAKWDDLSHPDAIIKINKYGKKYDAKAGMRRNKLIIDFADKVIAFWDGKSSGTKNSIDLAIKAGKPLDIYVR